MRINILGIRGIPAAHGGFETFAARLAPYLRDKGHDVTVYCQEDEGSLEPWTDMWEGIRRVHIRPTRSGPIGTMEFDLSCIRRVVKEPVGVDLVLGYNTALFCTLQRLKGRRIVMNMDGIEWKRAKWSGLARVWFYINEVVGANISHFLIADHPEIASHVRMRCFRNPVVIPYGSDVIKGAPQDVLSEFQVAPGEYFISIARIEPENSLFEIVSAFSRVGGSTKLIVLGRLDGENAYHSAVRLAANSRVIFPGAIYDPKVVSALRYHALAYMHGHQVGGTNPSLVEALGAGSPIIVHDNRFNRWVAGDDQFYFKTVDMAAEMMNRVISDVDSVSAARLASLRRHSEQFVWDINVLPLYEDVLVNAYNSL